jgi:hypothetical protein
LNNSDLDSLYYDYAEIFQEHPGASRSIQEHPGESRSIQENPGESRRIQTRIHATIQ